MRGACKSEGIWDLNSQGAGSLLSQSKLSLQMDSGPEVALYLTLKRHLNIIKHSRESDDLRPLDNLKMQPGHGRPKLPFFPLGCLSWRWVLLKRWHLGGPSSHQFTTLVFGRKSQSQLRIAQDKLSSLLCLLLPDGPVCLGWERGVRKRRKIIHQIPFFTRSEI